MENMKAKKIKETNLEWCKSHQNLLLNYKKIFKNLINDPLEDEDINFQKILKEIDYYE